MYETERADQGEGQELPERELMVLAFERRPWRHPGAKEEAIRVELGLSTARYYQVLNAAIDSPAALKYDPMLIRRLRRLRDGRRRGVSGGDPAGASPITARG
ncbi:uncharacterized protein DUF3263 [Homoserinimonas aerilata]|uniref:Uncharacterized protein DUF3263 n=1 Tax=Homoserinimonas aerilata TaxID=1162970 RepID=A0A542YG49_9MICO|nr:DUF3263 domain-containing protein [Homoserinimonas aerilata]TQL47049.1 uncharacterized protein DUF3263 [Homoserinimonas aerilata]